VAAVRSSERESFPAISGSASCCFRRIINYDFPMNGSPGSSGTAFKSSYSFCISIFPTETCLMSTCHDIALGGNALRRCQKAFMRCPQRHILACSAPTLTSAQLHSTIKKWNSIMKPSGRISLWWKITTCPKQESRRRDQLDVFWEWRGTVVHSLCCWIGLSK
jgi:hypothetical protein